MSGKIQVVLDDERVYVRSSWTREKLTGASSVVTLATEYSDLYCGFTSCDTDVSLMQGIQLKQKVAAQSVLHVQQGASGVHVRAQAKACVIPAAPARIRTPPPWICAWHVPKEVLWRDQARPLARPATSDWKKFRAGPVRRWSGVVE